MSYAEELEFKRQKVEDCLLRIGACEAPVSVICGADNTERYRNKVQFPISGDAIGFYAARTHTVTDVEDCLLQPLPAARLRGIYACAYSDKEAIPAEGLGYAAIAQGLGMTGDLYAGTRSATRGEAASMVCRLLERAV